MKRLKITALYKRMNGLNQRWTDASMPKKAKLIKDPVIVDGQVWDVGQKKREEE